MPRPVDHPHPTAAEQDLYLIARDPRQLGVRRPGNGGLGVRGGQKRPSPQVRDDPRAAREGQEREGQPDERRVDCERVSDPGTDARNDAVALHA